MSKKTEGILKKKSCEKLGQWIPSITNHFWWSTETCQGDAENLKERWLSITNHVVNRHDFPSNKVFKKCHMMLFSIEQYMSVLMWIGNQVITFQIKQHMYYFCVAEEDFFLGGGVGAWLKLF